MRFCQKKKTLDKLRLNNYFFGPQLHGNHFSYILKADYIGYVLG